MDKKALQDYCLDMMGITQYVRRSLVVSKKTFSYLIFIDGSERQADQLSPEKAQLLSKMLTALQWPSKSTAIEFLPLQDAATVKILFNQKLQEFQPIKVLLFGFEFGKILECVFEDNKMIYPQQMIFKVNAKVSSSRSDEIHGGGEKREGNNPENSAEQGIMVAQIPSLSTLDKDPNAKKIAWKTMQSLIPRENYKKIGQ